MVPMGVSFSVLMCYNGASQVALMVRNLPANAVGTRDLALSLDQEETLE